MNSEEFEEVKSVTEILPIEPRGEILIKIANIEKFYESSLSKKYKATCDSDNYWLCKTAYDLHINWEDPGFTELFDIPAVIKVIFL